jgi:alpha-tubulin suppressor-like RCC1 family protein
VCALTVSQRVKCFRLESGTEEAAVNSRSLDGLANVVQVKAASSADAALACALTEGGEVWCWGDARYGQLGDKATSNLFEPLLIHELPPIVEIAVGGNFACARSQQGQVYCWGSNRDGAVPDGQTGESRDPISVAWPF